MAKQRPPEKLTEQVFTRLTKSELLAVRVRMSNDRRTLSDWIRVAIHEKLERTK